MAIWTKEVRDGFPLVDSEHPKLVNPLLKINLVCELVSAAAIFFLVRLCVRRSLHAHSSRPNWLSREHRASICGLAAASVAWLEPSMILDAHGWPQWDVWILPFYLFAALAALKNRWFCMRLSPRSRRNAQRTAVVRGAVFCLLAAVAKKMDQCATRTRRVHSNVGSHRFTVATAHSGGMDRYRSGCCCQSSIRLAIQIAVSKGVVRRNLRLRHIRDRRVHRRQLRMVATRFYLRQRTLSVSFHQLVLQLCVTPCRSWLVIKR